MKGGLANRVRLMVSALRIAATNGSNVADALTLLNAHGSLRHVPNHEARFRVLDALASQWGLFLYNDHLSWLGEREFWQTWQAFPGWRGQRADRKFVLWSLSRNSRSLPGDTAECGIYTGGSSHLICATSAPGTLHHAFDSFEGLSPPKTEDLPTSEVAYHWRSGDLAATEETVRGNLQAYDFVRYYRGWIPTRFSEVSTLKFRFVHVDVDLYEPTRDSVRFFFDRLVPGGLLLCDDYGYETCAGARRACDELVQERCLDPVIHLPTGQGLIVARQIT
jgi:O-methyltransferase